MRALTCTLALLVGIVPVSVAMDWSQYLGPNGDRSSTESGWNTEWGIEGPDELWRTRIGIGYSSVIIAEGKAFTMGHDARSGEDIVYAKDATTGDVIWTHRYECNPFAMLHKGGPGASPLIYDGHVYTLSKDGHFFKFDMETGEVIWEKDLKSVLDSRPGYFGFTNSPFMLDGKIIVDVGTVAAMNPESGDVIWKTESHPHQYAPHGCFMQDGKTIITSMNENGLLLVDAETGAELGTYPLRIGEQNAFCNMPVYVDGTLLICGRVTHGLIKLDVTDPTAPEVIWERRNIQNLFNQPAVVDGRLYVHMREGDLHCIDYSTGETLWTSDELSDGPYIFANGKMLAISGKGELMLADVNPDGLDITGRKQVFGGNCWTPPVLSNGMIFCRNENGDVVALDVRS